MRALTTMGKLLLAAVLLYGLVGIGVGLTSLADVPQVGTNPEDAFTSYYVLEPVQATPSVPPYSLPLDLAEIVNFDKIDLAFRLSMEQKSFLNQNGFVVIPHGSCDDIVEPYKELRWEEIPIFVTSDTLLHLYHFLFNETLLTIEEQELFSALADLSRALMERAKHDYERLNSPLLKEAARRNVAYFAVAVKLLQDSPEGSDTEEPEYIRDAVANEIENIEAHRGLQPSAIFNSNTDCECDCLPCYCEDYSQYVPRGHYTRSERLNRYFKAMMWYGRMAFLLKGDDIVTERDSNIAAIQASLIAKALPEVMIGEHSGQEVWERIYAITAFFVGVADDLSPYEYIDAMDRVFGVEFAVEDLGDLEKLLQLKVELAGMRNPEIYGGSGLCLIDPPLTKEKLYGCLAGTKGMRFMGQRFTPDSYAFQNLAAPSVGPYMGIDEPFTMCSMFYGGPQRCFPRGLDVMAILGSERAYEILKEERDTEYREYDAQLTRLKKEFGEITVEGWNRNLYWSWLYSLKSLLQEFPEGYPTFMRTNAWQDKELYTSLASWAELRHDTILYVKQSYTPMPSCVLPPIPRVVGYVEPVPNFYARLLALTGMTRRGLSDLEALGQKEKLRLEGLESILRRLIEISKKELEHKELSEEDYDFIKYFGEKLENVIAGATGSTMLGQETEIEGTETTLIADVHTDLNTGKVLEEGVGYVNLILVAYNVPDGRIIISAGPVLSYYEFKQLMDKRLTDETWREMLQEDPPERPLWTRSFITQDQ